MDQIEIVEYQKKYKKYFKSLNYANELRAP